MFPAGIHSSLSVLVAAGSGQALLEILARMVRIVRDLLSLYG